MFTKYINLFTDFGFKKIFGSEANKDLLINFLNTLLKDKEKIKDLTFLKNEHLGFTELDRKAIFDLHCENEKGEKFIVELQNVKQQFFKDRSLFYVSFPIQEQAKRGINWNYELKAVYCIGILNFRFDDENKNDLVVAENLKKDSKRKIKLPKRVVNTVKLMDIDTKEVFYDKLTFVYVQIPNFKKKITELETNEDKWFFLFKNLERLKSIPEQVQEEIFKRIFEIAEIAMYKEAERMIYLDSLKHYWDLKNSYDFATISGYNEGLEKGLEQGLEKGLEQGLEKGLRKVWNKV